jgi:hypothetical protein
VAPSVVPRLHRGRAMRKLTFIVAVNDHGGVNVNVNDHVSA